MASEEFTPPLPKAVLEVLSRTSLAYLATSQSDEPHLSLMNFSVVSLSEGSSSGEGDIGIVMSTKRATKKFEALEKNPKVAVLVHDFEGLKEQSSSSSSESSPVTDHYARGSYSVTLYGQVEVLSSEESDADSDSLRHRCLDSLLKATGSRYLQFMQGPECALLLIRPTLARICNIADNVTTWAKSPAPSPGTSTSSGAGAAATGPASPSSS